MFSARLNYGSQVNGSVIHAPSEFDAASVASEIPLLTYGQEVSCFSALVSVLVFFLNLNMLFLGLFDW